MIGLIAFSFGSEPKEPNPCNIRLAREVARIVKEKTTTESILVAAQWEVAAGLPRFGIIPDHVVQQEHGTYIDSEGVWKDAAKYFSQRNIRDVIVVCHPFLHMFKCRGLVAKSGFNVIRVKVSSIGFCGKSSQWWTRGPAQLFVYALRQAIFGTRGK